MDRKLKNIVKYLVSLALGVALVLVCVKNVEWEEFLKALLSCRWEFVVLSMLVGVLACWLRALRWKMLLNPLDKGIPRISCFNAVNIGYLANLIFPRLGEFARCGYITKASGKDGDGRKVASYDKVLGTVVLERSWDAMSLLIVFFLTMALAWKRFGSFFSENIIGRFSEIEVPWLIVVIGALSIVGIGIIWVLSSDSAMLMKVRSFIQGIWKGVISCFQMRRSWMFLILTIGIWGCYWMTASSIIWALQGINTGIEGGEILLGMNLADAFFLMVVGAVSSLVPVPGGFGAYHYLLSVAMSSVYGIPLATGIIFATLSHESQVLSQIVCGTASYLYETLKG